ncbi:unnamed protein product [Hyaloperonospora brassicae]|uniref:Uncharacterized protein n=1 Tax=Hyaloperonospora brassicae TaxID=162125 RepID=A0AAV0U5Z6_HYABA|nr:unnamed protein product [Hyaloperonospora brassicae]
MTKRRELNVRELLELERQIYQESIDRVRKQQEELKAGTLEDFVRRCQPFEADRERELQVAQHQYHFSLQDASSLFEFDVQQANDVLRSDEQQLKLELLERTQQRRRRIGQRRQMLQDGIVDTSNVKAVNVTHSDRVDTRLTKLEPELLEKQLRRARQRMRTRFNFRHLSRGILPTPKRIVDDVVHECAKLQRNRERDEGVKMGQEEEAEQEVDVVVDEVGEKLMCRGRVGENGAVMDEAFCVGDPVVLLSKLTEEDFQGFVSALSKEEVKLVLVCGSHVRVTLARLRSGQCALRKQSETANSEPKALLGVAANLTELLQDPPDVRRRAATVMHRLKLKATDDN